MSMKGIELPAIRKAKLVSGKTLCFRDVTVADAEFILSLRTDKVKSRYLSETSSDVGSQREWLRKYSSSTGQAYFIIEYENKNIGTVRLYDSKKNSFCWGSWILMNSRPKHAAVESALMVYAYAFDHLNYQAAHFDVRKDNEKVWRFHERFGAKRVLETDADYFYTLNHDSIRSTMYRLSKFLPVGVSVIF